MELMIVTGLKFQGIIKMNKRGTDKIISVYWFAILILVAGGIYAMVYLFYGHPLDVRDVEANILANKVADCLSKQGRLNSGVIISSEDVKSLGKEYENNLLGKCHLNFNTEKEYDWENEIQYYIGADFYVQVGSDKPVFSLSEGNKNWLKYCEINREVEDYRRLPRCVERRFYSLGEDNAQYLIKIISIVGKTEKNAK